MVTFSYLLLFGLFFAFLGIIDSFFYDISFTESFFQNLMPKAETRRYIVTGFCYIALFYCFVVDYRLKKNK